MGPERGCRQRLHGKNQTTLPGAAGQSQHIFVTSMNGGCISCIAVIHTELSKRFTTLRKERDMKFITAFAFAFAWPGAASMAGTAPLKIDMTPEDVRLKCAEFDGVVENTENGCFNPANGSALFCSADRCFELAPDPRYAELKRRLENSNKKKQIE